MAETNHTQESRESSGGTPAGHELRDLSPKNIALFAVALTVTILLVLLVSYELFRRFATIEMRAQIPPSPLTYTREPAPGPHLQVNPTRELKEMRAAEDSVLNHYGWIDPDKGIVRIPIDRAIEILAQKGLPARTKIEEQKQEAGSNKQGEQESEKASKEQGAR